MDLTWEDTLSAWEDAMVIATVYRAMAAEHHCLAGMYRSPESREQHSRLETELSCEADWGVGRFLLQRA